MARLLLLYGVVLSSGGIPLLYLGDEVGTLNDHDYAQDAHKAVDSRWLHRPPRDAARYAQRQDPASQAGQLHAGLRHLIGLRRHLPLLAGTPTASSNLVVEQPSGGNPRLWVVNQDNDSVSVFDSVSRNGH